ncbi:MAG TPA: hypothetical protein PKZ76_06010 [Xanthomonadaceae bacterium]|nr:hypothetical protein [Xanthomonadaceae bacterium]
MRTTIDLPDDVLRRAKIKAVERGSSLREFVVAAIRRELKESSPAPRRRMTCPPIKLAADSPLRTLSPDEIKRLDSEVEIEADVARSHAGHR